MNRNNIKMFLFLRELKYLILYEIIDIVFLKSWSSWNVIYYMYKCCKNNKV